MKKEKLNESLIKIEALLEMMREHFRKTRDKKGVLLTKMLIDELLVIINLFKKSYENKKQN